MNQTVLDLVLMLFPFFLSAFMGPRVVKWCTNQKLIAEVNKRSSHKKPTPSGGGIGFIVAALPIMMAVSWFLPSSDPVFLKVLMFGGLAVAALGWFDDVKNLPAKLRLLIQFAAVGIGLYFMPPLFDGLAWWIEKPILLFAWVWFLNLTLVPIQNFGHHLVGAWKLPVLRQKKVLNWLPLWLKMNLLIPPLKFIPKKLLSMAAL